MSAAFIGLDLAKSVFQVHGVDVHGKVVVLKRLRRDAVLAFFANILLLMRTPARSSPRP
jgi:transposase